MKIEDMTRPGVPALGVTGVAATAMLGFAAGVAVARDPELLRRTARSLARNLARSLERATLIAARAREHVGDLWAEAREEAIAEVDAANFNRAAKNAGKGAPAAAAAAAAAPSTAARQRASRPRKPGASRKSAPRIAEEQAADQSCVAVAGARTTRRGLSSVFSPGHGRPRPWGRPESVVGVRQPLRDLALCDQPVVEFLAGGEAARLGDEERRFGDHCVSLRRVGRLRARRQRVRLCRQWDGARFGGGLHGCS